MKKCKYNNQLGLMMEKNVFGGELVLSQMTTKPKGRFNLAIVTNIDVEFSQLSFKCERPLEKGDTVLVVEEHNYENAGNYIP